MKSAVLVVDVQKGCFDPSPHPYQADLVVERINELTAKARQSGVPVVFVQHEESGLEFNSDNWKLVSALDVAENDVRLRKTASDSFLRTNLDALLTSWGIEQVIVCGYATEFCVDSTIRCAAANGYAVVIVSDAHTTHDKPHASAQQIRLHHNVTLPSIDSYGVKIKALATSEINF
ncbi:cysteine hydrolase family protein [Glaciimonas soli]|uniref:Isochorismatase family protein n=1 Tax=Glaciimonas soli TaxID=2590999 RepID=A0A843YW77_9BURK|nr:cysteine hydrolase family protein [Glaciimonas soli]MQR01482.1 isochorismatase family protein [Glaciimonas soli]